MSKAITMSLFVLFIQLALGISTWAGLVGTEATYDTEYIDAIQTQAQGDYTEAKLTDSTTYLPFADIFKSLSMLATMLGKALFLPFKILHQTFLIPYQLAIYLSIPIYAVHLLALIQFLRGVNLPQMK